MRVDPVSELDVKENHLKRSALICAWSMWLKSVMVS